MSDATAPLRGRRILIVEDELVIAMELEALLTGLGCQVLGPVPTVGKALRALEGDRPDAAVLDVNLQGERVTPVAEALQKQAVPFVLVTGYGVERLDEPALQKAPRLSKPVDGKQLARALAGVLTQP